MATDKFSRSFIGAVQDEWQLYSNNEEDYTLGSPIGFGASSIVYTATYHPRDGDGEPVDCALKVLDLDRLPPHALRLLERETQLMSISKHPNVLRVRGSWTSGHKLFIAMRLMNSGSASDVMRYGWPGGMEEDVVKAVLKQALEGLNYFHINGLIHRDIKSANLLLDKDGTVLLGDLGVAAFLWDSEDSAAAPTPESRRVISFEPAVANATSTASPSRHVFGKRKSFVGTPCWMAPEVIQGKKYDSKADIWSFGITALELTQGRPPRSREAPQKVLLRTVQDAPPTLDRTGGPFKYSRAFYEIVESCLIKDPAKRPTAEELLQTPFFRGAKGKKYLVNTILKGLPPLTSRQERRKRQNSSVIHSTMASWDFSLTHQASPGALAYHMSLSRASLGSSDVDSNLKEEHEHSEALFEFDEEQIREERATKTDTVNEEPEDFLSPISTPGPSTPASSNAAPSRPETPPPLPQTSLPIPFSIPSQSKTSAPSPLPSLTRQSVKSLSSPSDHGPLTPPTTGHGSKLWRRVSRTGEKEKKKGLVGVLDTIGASDMVRSVSGAFSSKSSHP